MQLRDFVAGRLSTRRFVQAAFEPGWKFHLPEFFQRQAAVADHAKRKIHAVEAGARHDAEDEFGFHEFLKNGREEIRNKAQTCPS